jgi:hypothetical protein
LANHNDEARMSGILVLEHRRILTEMCAPGLFPKVLAALPADVREEYEAIGVLSWPRVRVAEQVFEAASTVLDRLPADLHTEVSRRAVEHALTKLWRFMLRFASDEALITRTPMLYRKGFQRGRLEARITSPGMAEVQVHDWHDMPEFSLRGLRIAIETVMSLAERKNVRLKYQRTEYGPMFVVTWTI